MAPKGVISSDNPFVSQTTYYYPSPTPLNTNQNANKNVNNGSKNDFQDLVDNISSMDCDTTARVGSGLFGGICCCFGTLCCCIGNWVTAGVSLISAAFGCLFAAKKSK